VELSGESSFSDQQNNAAIDQTANLANTCSETGTGTSIVGCVNDVSNFVGQIEQDNSAKGEGADNIVQQNQVVVDQNLVAVNDYDEQDSGSNLATCENTALNSIASITQDNSGTGDGNDDIDQSNFVGITQDLHTTNDCDESGSGDNLKICSITSSNEIGDILQTNDATGTDEDNNVLSISQDLTATNNCDDTTDGNNAGSCTIDLHLIVPDITQTNGETLTITQSENILNECEGDASCSASRTIEYVKPTTLTATTAATTEEESDSNSNPTITSAALESETETETRDEQAQVEEEEGGNDENDESGSNSEDAAKLSATEETSSASSEEGGGGDDGDDRGDEDDGDDGSGGDVETSSASSEEGGGGDDGDDSGDEDDDEPEEEPEE
jgi:hypothetical protein